MKARTAIELLCEDPQNVDPTEFGLDEPSTNLKMLAWLKGRHPKVVGQYNGLPIQKTGNRIFVEKEGLAYLVQYTDNRFAALGTRYVTQVKVWRRLGGYPMGLAQYVFWELLFPVHRTLISDSKQTNAGGYFWGDRAVEALERGLHVYFVDASGGRLKEIVNPDQFRSLRSRIYGDDRRFQNLRIIISQEPVQGRGELRLEDLGTAL